MTPEQQKAELKAAKKAAQKAAQLKALNELKAAMPIDAVPGYSVSSSAASPESPWVKNMKSFAADLKVNAFAYYNFERRNAKTGRVYPRKCPTKILSPDGFPPWVTVSYAYPPPFAFAPYLSERVVKHMVFHSFGHMWHASVDEGAWVGWFNSDRDGRGVQPYDFKGKTAGMNEQKALALACGVQPYEFEDKTVFVAKESTPENLAHFTRFSAGLRACLSSAAQASANFFIDRDGNLVVIGDANDMMYTSDGLSGTSLGVELEEAFFVIDKTKTATWKSGGNPDGTAGNVVYLTYSDQQMFTLSILCKKLETAFPAIAERNVEFVKRAFTKDGPPGYTVHNWIKGSKHFDVSPHFLTQDLWDAFFALVDTQTQINPTNIWKPKQKYTMGSGEQIANQPLAGTSIKSMTDIVLQSAKNQGQGLERAFNKANSDRAGVNEAAGKEAVKEAQATSQKAANTEATMQQTEAPPVDIVDTISVDDQLEFSDDIWTVGAE